MARNTWSGLVFLAAVGSGLYVYPSAVVAVRRPDPAPPELPRRVVDTAALPLTGAAITVRAGEDLQAVLDAAQPGDVIALEAGATFPGPFTLPNKPEDAWITIRSAAPVGSLPLPGTRIDPRHASLMPKLEAAAGAVLQAAPGAHHYRLVGIEIRPAPGTFLPTLVALGGNQSSVAELPHHLIFDRCYLHGDPRRGSGRGIALNAADTAVIDSYLSGFKGGGSDAQAIAGWNGPGPLRIANSYLEAAGQSVLIGGSAPSIPRLVPSDIELVGNHLAQSADEDARGSVGNRLELRNARRVLVEGNLFDDDGARPPPDLAVLLAVRQRDDSAPWSVVEDVTLRNNVVGHVGAGLRILARGDRDRGAPPARIGVDLEQLVRAGAVAATPAAPEPAARPAGSGRPQGVSDGRSARLAFWACALALAYTYVGYPALVFAWGRLRPRSFRSGPIEPSVSLVLVAHNEAGRIGSRIANLLGLDYPRDRLEILVGSDGSDDGTAEQVRAGGAANVRLFAFGRRRGKAAVVNDLVARARGEIVVLADARQQFDPRAVRALVAPFADPTVGAVSGELILLPGPEGSAAGEGVGLYWRYEKLIRRSESRVDSSVGATGAIYAIRRSLFKPIPRDTVLDDVLIPFNVVRRGYRVLFEPGARAYDRALSNGDDELRRKVRTIAGTFQLFARQPWLLSPLRNRLWFQTVSHKAFRLLTPFALAGALLSNLPLVDSPLYLGTLAAQLAFYAAALVGHSLRHGRRLAFVTLPYVLCLLSWATVVALCRFLRRNQSVTWERVPAR